MKEGEKRRDSPARQQNEDRSREQANGAGVLDVVRSQWKEEGDGDGDKAVSVDPRENSGANGGKDGE